MNLTPPVVGILRGIDADFFGDVMRTSFEAGLQAVEVTMNTKGAEQIVSKNRPAVPEGKILGMGTIRNLDEAKRAADAGAMFFVTPNLDESVIEYARQHNIPVIAGAFTPTEVYRARAAGADMVKVFPCGSAGPRYIQDLSGPFDDIPMVAVGGVTISNVADFFKAGARAVGAGPSLFGQQALELKNLANLAENVKKFIAACKACG